MKKQKNRLALIALLVGVVGFVAEAAIEASSVIEQMSNISALTVQAKSELSQAAKGNDPQAILTAQLHVQGTEAALKDAKKAFASFNTAKTEKEKKVALKKIKAAYNRALKALRKSAPKMAPKSGKTGDAYVPNVADSLWKSDSARRVADESFRINYLAGGSTFGDRDATPE